TVPAPKPPAAVKTPRAGPGELLSADRLTVWKPGVSGGIPRRTAICRTLHPPAGDAAAAIQNAINACPVGEVVQLSTRTYLINGGGYLLVHKGITLRGAGPGQTILQKTDGAKPGQEATGPKPSPVVIIGPARWNDGQHPYRSTDLTADAIKGASSVTVAST